MLIGNLRSTTKKITKQYREKVNKKDLKQKARKKSFKYKRKQ